MLPVSESYSISFTCLDFCNRISVVISNPAGTIVKNTYTGHTQWIQSVCWSTTEEHLFISGSYDNQVKLWDMRSPKAPLFDLLGHEDKVHDCDWSNPKYMISGGADNSVRIFKSKKSFQS